MGKSVVANTRSPQALRHHTSLASGSPLVDATHSLNPTAHARYGHSFAQMAVAQQTMSSEAGAEMQLKSEGGQPSHPNVPVAAGGGSALPGPLRGKMERVFGHSFSDVRIHSGGEAEQVGALAYTRGSDVHFQPGLYDPLSLGGQELLGHELTHVVQQRAGRVSSPQQKPGGAAPINADAGLEAEADALGARAARGVSAPVSGASGGGLQRKADLGTPIQRNPIGAMAVRPSPAQLSTAALLSGMPSVPTHDPNAQAVSQSPVTSSGVGTAITPDVYAASLTAPLPPALGITPDILAAALAAPLPSPLTASAASASPSAASISAPPTPSTAPVLNTPPMLSNAPAAAPALPTPAAPFTVAPPTAAAPTAATAPVIPAAPALSVPPTERSHRFVPGRKYEAFTNILNTDLSNQAATSAEAVQHSSLADLNIGGLTSDSAAAGINVGSVIGLPGNVVGGVRGAKNLYNGLQKGEDGRDWHRAFEGAAELGGNIIQAGNTGLNVASGVGSISNALSISAAVTAPVGLATSAVMTGKSIYQAGMAQHHSSALGAMDMDTATPELAEARDHAQQTQKKRRNRAVLNTTANGLMVAGAATTIGTGYTGVGAGVGAGLAASGAGLKAGAWGLRKMKQSVRNSAERREEEKANLAPGEKMGLWDRTIGRASDAVFKPNTDKSTKKKEEEYDQHTLTILGDPGQGKEIFSHLGANKADLEMFDNYHDPSTSGTDKDELGQALMTRIKEQFKYRGE